MESQQNEQITKRVKSHTHCESWLTGRQINNNHSNNSDEIAPNVYKLAKGHRIGFEPVMRSHFEELKCNYCFSPAINPYRCSEESSHIFCYECVANDMIVRNSSQVSCPYCKHNIIDLDAMIVASHQTIAKLEEFYMKCEKGCGLIGTPIALANHSCLGHKAENIGHTANSSAAPKLSEENAKLREENTQLTKAIQRSKDEAIKWQSKYCALKTINSNHLNNILGLSLKLEEESSKKTHFEHKIKQIEEKENQLKMKILENQTKIIEMETENQRLKKTFKEKLKLAKKIYGTQIEQMSDNIKLLEKQVITGVIKIETSVGSESISTQTAQTNDDFENVIGKADNHKFMRLLNDSEGTVFFKNKAYKLPLYDSESISIIDFKDVIRKLIPDLKEVEDNYELCYFSYKLVRENENTCRTNYSESKPKPLKTIVLRDRPNFIYLPKHLINGIGESIDIIIPKSKVKTD
jgi:hypothetical protein